METAAWAVAEALGADLGDRRRNEVWAGMLTTLLPSVGQSFSAALGDAGRQAANGLLRRPGLTVDQLLAGHYQATAARCAAAPLVLISQDSTSFNYTTRCGIQGLGRLASKSSARGLWAHSALALTATGRPLGLLGLRFWSRGEERTKAARREREYEAKESFKWERALWEVADRLPPECQAVMVSDRESDVFQYLRTPVRPGLFKLVRAAWARACDDLDQGLQQSVLAAVRQAPEALRVQLSIPAGAGRKARRAELVIRYTRVRVHSPRSWPAAQRDTVELWVVAADEVAPAGPQRLSWTLLTTYPVTSAAVAQEVLEWYQRRWRVEQAHRALKLDGYRVERLQCRTLPALQLVLATYWVVAWRAMNLALEAREQPDLPALARFGADELLVLRQLTGQPVETLRQAVHQVAKLGGWPGYPSSPPPGVQVVQRGLDRLDAMLLYHRAITKSPPGEM